MTQRISSNKIAKNISFPLITLSSYQKQAFRNKLYSYFTAHCRDLPWRKTSDPYRVLISEIMLQQTQVDRVISKYEEFIAAFPNFNALNNANLSRVYAVWQGMGYNRRALSLKRIAEKVISEHAGELPQSVHILSTFPGIGTATASSICAFAFDIPAVFIETNIRSVFIHFFCKNRESVADKEIIELVQQTIDMKHPRKWYSALMDYGAMLKKTHANPSRQSAGHVVQSPFIGSRRQVRGVIMKVLCEQPGLTAQQLGKRIDIAAVTQIKDIADTLCREGLLVKVKRRYRIA